MKNLVLLFVLIFTLIAFTEMFSQGIPETANYQGVLKDASGNIVPDGNYNITFKLYDSVVGGTVLWTEAKVVNIVGGIINTQLGSVAPLNSNLFIGATWLGITIESGSELTPRIALTSAPYSFMTMNVADGRVVKSLNSLKDNINLIAGSNITITPTGNDLTISATGGGGGGTVTQVNTGAGLTGGPITTTGTISVATEGITNTMLQNNAVTSSKITDGSIVTADLGDNSVNSSKIVDGTVITTDLADNTVTTAKIVDGTIASGDLANNSVTSAKIVDGTITSADIGNTQVLKSLNSLKDDVNLVAGTNITITPTGQNLTISSAAGGLGGSGTTNYVSKFTNSTTLGNSVLYETGNKIGINTTTPNYSLSINSSGNAGLGLKIFRDGGVRLLMGYSLTTQEGWAFDSFLDGFRLYKINSAGAIERTVLTTLSNGNVGIGTETPSYPLHLNVNNSTASIYSVNSATDIYSAGVYGEAAQLDWYGVGGYFVGGWYGVYGSVTPSGSNGYIGVIGQVLGGSGTNNGIYGIAGGTGTNYGVYGYASGGTINWAGYFVGNVNVSGTLSKGGGSFKIDHPLDPANKYLYHSFVESPDMKNIYDGNAITDGSGFATITLPDWFEALNKDFRYQLTVIGEFAQAIISQEIQNNQFAIRTDKPNVKVSWQVTGIRKDAFAEKNRIPIEEMKQGDDIGKYIYPDAFGLPETMGIDYKNNHPDKEKDFK